MVPAVLLIIIGFVGCKYRGLAVAILTLAVAFNGISRCAFCVNHVDIAPRFVPFQQITLDKTIDMQLQVRVFKTKNGF